MNRTRIQSKNTNHLNNTWRELDLNLGSVSLHINFAWVYLIISPCYINQYRGLPAFRSTVSTTRQRLPSVQAMAKLSLRAKQTIT